MVVIKNNHVDNGSIVSEKEVLNGKSTGIAEDRYEGPSQMGGGSARYDERLFSDA
jgi:hypothetical protein